MSNMLKIASDGSCLKNPGGAIGWAWGDDQGRWMSNGYASGTNQSAELLGLASIFLAFPKRDLFIQLDSQYTLNIASKWMNGWARAGWTRKGNNEIKNLDIIKVIYKLANDRKQAGLKTEYEWVKGHGKAGHFPLNLVADQRCGESAHLIKVGKSAYQDSSGNLSSPRQDALLKAVGMV